jgi:hypothetical protein
MSAKEKPDFTKPIDAVGAAAFSPGEKQVPFAEGASGARSSTGKNNGDAVGVVLGDVQMRPVKWLWPAYIALGKMTVIDGNPGVGKSTLALDIAARTSTNRAMPDGSASCLGELRGVVLLSAEDGAEDTIAPRLAAMGGDASRVFCLKGVVTDDGERMPCITDLDAIAQGIEKVDAALVVIDPLFAYTGKSDAHRDSEMRGALAPLIALCEEKNVALLVVRHLNKNSGEGAAMYRGGGTIGIVAAARCAFVAGRDPEDETRCVLAPTKMNLCAPPLALAYRLEGANVPISGTMGVVGTSRIVWEGAVVVAADALVAPSRGGELKLEDAVEFLREELAGGPVTSASVETHARQQGHSTRTLGRARRSLEIVAYRDGEKKQGPWMLRLPEGVPGGSTASSGGPRQPAGPVGQDPVGQAPTSQVGRLVNVPEYRVLGSSSETQTAMTHEVGRLVPPKAPLTPSGGLQPAAPDPCPDGPVPGSSPSTTTEEILSSTDITAAVAPTEQHGDDARPDCFGDLWDEQEEDCIGCELCSSCSNISKERLTPHALLQCVTANDPGPMPLMKADPKRVTSSRMSRLLLSDDMD